MDFSILVKYVKDILVLEYEIKQIREDIKQIKKEAKKSGINVKILDKIVRELKKREQEDVSEYLKALKNVPEILDLISRLWNINLIAFPRYKFLINVRIDLN